VQLATFEMPSTRQFPPPGPGDFTVHDPKVRGSVAYFSWYAEGVVMADISNPANPEFLAQFATPPAEDPQNFFTPAQVNVWGCSCTRTSS
jgi:hypothetical protein